MSAMIEENLRLQVATFCWERGIIKDTPVGTVQFLMEEPDWAVLQPAMTKTMETLSSEDWAEQPAACSYLTIIDQSLKEAKRRGYRGIDLLDTVYGNDSTVIIYLTYSNLKVLKAIVQDYDYSLLSRVVDANRFLTRLEDSLLAAMVAELDLTEDS